MIKFHFYKVTEMFIDSPFSNRDMMFQKHGAFCHANNIFTLQQKWFTKLEDDDFARKSAVETLLSCIHDERPLLHPLQTHYNKEKDLFLRVTNVLGRFCRHVTLNRMTYMDEFVKKCKDLELSCADKISCEHLGMGGKGIWRGEPDYHLRGINPNPLWP